MSGEIVDGESTGITLEDLAKSAKPCCKHCHGVGYHVLTPGGQMVREGNATFFQSLEPHQRKQVARACLCALKRYAKANGIGPKET